MLTVLGVAIGVFSLVTVNNISRSGTGAVTGELESLGLCGISICPEDPSDEMTRLTSRDLNIVKKNKHVKYCTPLIIRPACVIYGESEINAMIWGINSSAPKIASMDTVSGRQINGRDTEQAENVCVIDRNLAEKISPRLNPVGKKIILSCSGMPEEFNIIGVTKVGNGIVQNMMGDYVPNFVYIPYTTFQNISGSTSFDQIAIKPDESLSSDTVGQNIAQALSGSAGIKGAYCSNNFSKQKKELTNLMNITTIVFSAVGGISLLVASLSIMTVMMVSVNERKREIGIKKSLGATRKTILAEFLIESAVISIVGCILGIILGSASYWAFSAIFGFGFDADIKNLLSVITISIISSIVFGIYPAVKASKLDPAEAFRNG